jgi:hypothetical protein
MIVRRPVYGICEAVPSTLPNPMDDTRKQYWPKPYDEFSPVHATSITGKRAAAR